MSTGTLLKHLRPIGGTSQADQGNTGVPERHSRYGLLLVMLLFSYVLSAFVQRTWVLALQIALFLGVSALAVQSERLKRRTVHVLVGVTIGGSIIAITLALTQSANAAGGVAYLWAALMLLFAVVLIVRRVLAQPEVSLQSIFGAVSAYVIIGLMFASVYGAINQFTAGDFFVQGAASGTLKTFQYFSFTTLTTLGYGDYTAKQSGGQAVAVMEAMLGQIFLATLVARLVSAFRRTDRGHETGSAATAGPARAPGGGNQPGSAQPARPGDKPGLAGAPRPTTRASPRARARQARRSRLRSQR
jgi:ion channel